MQGFGWVGGGGGGGGEALAGGRSICPGIRSLPLPFPSFCLVSAKASGIWLVWF